ncbi:hypothetical protein LZ32DRAFT_152177 [Colletotrichum eremochloae]|nr:hypothetical protein LZ32DRAFT_152177 [Colletotrichum eremochloae]
MPRLNGTYPCHVCVFCTSYAGYLLHSSFLTHPFGRPSWLAPVLPPHLPCKHTNSPKSVSAHHTFTILTRTVLAHLLQLLLPPPPPPATGLCLFNYITADHNLFARTHDVLQQDRKNQSSLSIQQTRAQVQETCPLSHLQLLFCVLRRAHPSEHLQSLLAPNHLQPDSHSIFCRARTCAT